MRSVSSASFLILLIFGCSGNPELIQNIQGLRINSLAFSLDSRHLAAQSAGAVKLLDPATGRENGSIKTGEAGIIALAADGILYSANAQSISSFQDGKPSRNFPFENILTLRVSPDAGMLIAQSSNRVSVFDARSGLEKKRIEDKSIRCAEFSPDGKTIGLCANGGIVLLEIGTWTAKNLDLEKRLLALSFSPDGSAFAATDGRVMGLFRVDDGRQIWVDGVQDFSQLFFSGDGLSISAVSRNEILWFDAQSGEKNMYVSCDGISAVAFSNEGRYCACADESGSLRIWNLYTAGKLRGKFK